MESFPDVLKEEAHLEGLANLKKKKKLPNPEEGSHLEADTLVVLKELIMQTVLYFNSDFIIFIKLLVITSINSPVEETCLRQKLL